MSWKRWLLVAVALAVVGGVGAPYAFIHFIEGKAPDPLTLGTQTSPVPSGAPGSLDGTWKVATGSVAGYRVKEILFGQNNVAAGRTTDVTGSVGVAGTVVRSGSFTADLTTVHSDKERRDAQFQGRIMDTTTYPKARFTFTTPVDLAPLPAAGSAKSATVPGKLMLHGTTKDVSVTVTCRRTGAVAEIVGSIPVTFADYGIPNPSFGPVTTEDHGVLEFSLKLTHA
jgi:polyisoprenoid-binding protein YceI